MRMWMVSPHLLCDRHLLGEHGELHKHRHCFVKQYSIKGRITPEVQIEPRAMQLRHDALAAEMLRRGFKHNSPYVQPDLSYLPAAHREAKVSRETSLLLLFFRCQECANKIKEADATNV